MVRPGTWGPELALVRRFPDGRGRVFLSAPITFEANGDSDKSVTRLGYKLRHNVKNLG